MAAWELVGIGTDSASVSWPGHSHSKPEHSSLYLHRPKATRRLVWLSAESSHNHCAPLSEHHGCTEGSASPAEGPVSSVGTYSCSLPQGQPPFSCRSCKVSPPQNCATKGSMVISRSTELKKALTGPATTELCRVRKLQDEGSTFRTGLKWAKKSWDSKALAGSSCKRLTGNSWKMLSFPNRQFY